MAAAGINWVTPVRVNFDAHPVDATASNLFGNEARTIEQSMSIREAAERLTALSVVNEFIESKIVPVAAEGSQIASTWADGWSHPASAEALREQIDSIRKRLVEAFSQLSDVASSSGFGDIKQSVERPPEVANGLGLYEFSATLQAMLMPNDKNVAVGGHPATEIFQQSMKENGTLSRWIQEMRNTINTKKTECEAHLRRAGR